MGELQYVMKLLLRAGTDEGAFAWLTLNYLLGHLGKAEDKTVAAIDLGGGSVQQAFAVKAEDAGKAPPGYITQLSGGGRSYSVYVHRCTSDVLVPAAEPRTA